MSNKLEELFNLPPTDTGDGEVDAEVDAEASKMTAVEVEEVERTMRVVEKVDAAMKTVTALDETDVEMDDIAKEARSSYDTLMDLGLNVDPRFAGKYFEVASQMLNHAIVAKTNKMDRKLRTIDLQLKQARILQQEVKTKVPGEEEEGTGHVVDRNALLKELLAQAKTDNDKG